MRLVANLVRADDHTAPEHEDNVAIGKRVRACFLDLDDTRALPQFHLSDEAPEVTPWRAPV